MATIAVLSMIGLRSESKFLSRDSSRIFEGVRCLLQIADLTISILFTGVERGLNPLFFEQNKVLRSFINKFFEEFCSY